MLQIKQQIDFLTEVYDAGSNADLLLLQAANTDDKTAEKLIVQAIDLKFKNTENHRFGLKYLIELDATFILEALRKLPSSV